MDLKLASNRLLGSFFEKLGAAGLHPWHDLAEARIGALPLNALVNSVAVVNPSYLQNVSKKSSRHEAFSR